MSPKRLQVTYNPAEEENKKVRLKRRHTVLDDHHAVIGYVKNRIFYSLTDEEKGKFFKDENGEFVLKSLDPKAQDKSDSSYTKIIGYLRDNYQVYSPTGRRIYILEQKNYFPIIVAVIVILALLATILSMRQIIVSKDYIPTIFITEVDGDVWSDEKEITVFKNGEYNNSVIYPGIEGSYSFRLENRNPDPMTYSMVFAEENQYKINMLYRLKRNGVYLKSGEYQPIGYLFFEGLMVDVDKNDVFTLEWTWKESDNDTEIGMSNATYVLKIRVDANT